MRKLFHGHDQRRADESTPIGIPGVVDASRVLRRADVRFFGLLLIVSIPGCSSA
jgi:hypothetical protein